MKLGTFINSSAFSTISRRLLSTMERKIKLSVGAESFNINYVSAGSGEKGLILLPGALGSAETDFQPQIMDLPTLLPNYTIIGWDPPGYGKSRPPERTFPLNFFYQDASLANSLMKSLGFNKYSILGWSDGGITGIIMSANHSDAIDNLVIFGANAFILPDEIEIYENIRDVSKWSSKMRTPFENVYGVEYFPKIWSAWVDGMKNIYNQRNGDICRDELAKIKADTLIVHGAKDPMIDKCHPPYLMGSIKSSQYFEFPEGKHNIHLRYAQEFNKIVSDFLRRSEK